jgi:hypothetical protein
LVTEQERSRIVQVIDFGLGEKRVGQQLSDASE